MIDIGKIVDAKKSKHAERQWWEIKRKLKLSVQCFPVHTTVSALLLDEKEDRVLLGFHPQFSAWSWIGGHVERGETYIAALRREVFEETGVRDFTIVDDEIKSIRSLFVSPYHKRGKRENPHIHLSLGYLGIVHERNVTGNEELEKLAWHDLKHFMNITGEPWMNAIYAELLAQYKE